MPRWCLDRVPYTSTLRVRAARVLADRLSDPCGVLVDFEVPEAT